MRSGYTFVVLYSTVLQYIQRKEADLEKAMHSVELQNKLDANFEKLLQRVQAENTSTFSSQLLATNNSSPEAERHMPYSVPNVNKVEMVHECVPSAPKTRIRHMNSEALRKV